MISTAFLGEVDATQLRQGDLVRGVFRLRPRCSSLQVLGELAPDPSDGPMAGTFALVKPTNSLYKVLTPASPGPCIILSQCCDLQPRDGSGRSLVYPPVTLAPVTNLPGDLSRHPERLDALTENRSGDFQGLYYLGCLPKGDAAKVVDFRLAFSLPAADYRWLLDRKVSQMTDPERVRFKRKLAEFFGRPTQEERDSGLWD